MSVFCDPTADEIVDTLELCGGRFDAAWDAILNILREKLPGAIERFNERRGTSIPAIASWNIARESLADVEFPAILVGMSMSTEALSADLFRDIGQVVVYFVQGKSESRLTITHSSLVAHLIRATLYHTHPGLYTETDQQIWRVLVPGGIGFLPRQWETYDGMSVHYKLILDPASGIWDDPPAP